MDPLKRDNPGVRATNHEDRIQALERRLHPDYPIFGSASLDTITVELADDYEFGFSSPSPSPCVLPTCDPDDWHTDGDYLVLPLGYNGMLRVYMTAACTAGNSQFGNYRTVVDGGDQDQHGKSRIGYLAEIWRNGAPFGSSGAKVFQAWGEHPPPTPSTSFNQRFWWYNDIAGGSFSMSSETDQWALKPQFVLAENLAGPATIEGLELVVELLPPTQRLGGYS